MSLENILGRFFSSQASKEELQQLDDWKNEAEDNIEALNEMNEIWEKSNDLKNYEKFDTNKAWLKVNSAIVSEELKLPSKSTSSSKTIIRRLLPYAASIAILISAFWAYNNMDNTPKLEEYSSSEKVLELNLADKSKIVLDKESSLTVQSDFKNKRTVKANGRVFFDVSSDPSRPFVVNTHHGSIKVVGTSFTVLTTQDKTEVFLLEGQINFTHENKLISLLPSDALVIENGELIKYRFDAKNINSWRSNRLVFKDVYVTEVFKSLEDHFLIDIVLDKKNVNSNCRISSTFDNLSLTDILSEIDILYDLNFELTESKLKIKKLSC